MCEGALAKGLPCITFADHLDMNPNDEGYGFYQPDRSFKEIAAAKRQFAGRLKVLQGVEFGEPHLYPGTLAVLHERPYDVILGSIHWVNDDDPGSPVARSNPRAYFERYYAVMLAMVQTGGFDVLAHFDLPKRYLNVDVSDLPIIDDIMTVLAASDIALEINTSSLRKGVSDTMPGSAILEKYVQEGGTRITLASDAHTPRDIGADFDEVRRLLSTLSQLEVGHFENRRFVHSRS